MGPLGLLDLPEAVVDFLADELLELEDHVLVELADDESDGLLHAERDFVVHAIFEVL